MKENMVTWFEIPVTDMDRAKKFYEAVFNVKLMVQDMGELVMAWFPHIGGAPGAMGTLVKNENYKPSEAGSLLYFFSENVQNELDRIEKAGGKIKQGKKMISPEHGYMALFNDTEGNRLALYSKQ
jgi:hypothetical protein